MDVRNELIVKMCDEKLLSSEHYREVMARSVKCFENLYSFLKDGEKETLLEYEETLNELLHIYKITKCELCNRVKIDR